MKHIYCELHLFDLNQKVFIIDSSTGNSECVAITTMEELPSVISAISNEKNIYKISLGGSSISGEWLSQQILNYSKKYYNNHNIEIEVLK